MNIVGLFISITLVLLIWFLLGFVGFLISAKRNKFTQFNKEAKEEFIACVILGGITFIVMAVINIVDWFKYFMDNLLYRMNSK